MIEPDHLPNPQGYVVDGFRFNHVNGRLFKFQPVADQFLGKAVWTKYKATLKECIQKFTNV